MTPRPHRFSGPPRALIALIAVVTLACGEPTPAVSGARFALSAELLRADTITLVADGPEGPVEAWSSSTPHDDPGATIFAPLAPGAYTRLSLEARLGPWPLFVGESTPFEVREGETVDVRVVVDPVGVLAVVPSGLPALAEVSAAAIPQAPLPGDAASVPLALEDDALSATVPTGRYRVELTLPDGFDLVTVDVLEIDVVAGTRSTLRPAFAAIDAPLPVPAVVDRLLVEVVGGALLSAGRAVDVLVEAVDADGRRVPGYTGDVEFTADVELPLGLQLPATYRFDADDAGRHVFAEGLVAPVVELALPFNLIVRDVANELSTRVPLCVPVPLLGGC